MPTLAPSAVRPETRNRILDAAFDRIGDVGLARTSVEDVARAAGLSRQTIYRYYPSKDHLVMALVLREEEKFLDGIRAAFAADEDLHEALYDSIVFCLRFAREHPLLDRLLATDAEKLLPFLTTRNAPVIQRAREVMVGLLTSRGGLRDQHLEGTVDAAVRVIVSYALSPPDRPAQDVARDMAYILTSALGAGEAAS